MLATHATAPAIKQANVSQPTGIERLCNEITPAASRAASLTWAMWSQSVLHRQHGFGMGEQGPATPPSTAAETASVISMSGRHDAKGMAEDKVPIVPNDFQEKATMAARMKMSAGYHRVMALSRTDTNTLQPEALLCRSNAPCKRAPAASAVLHLFSMRGQWLPCLFLSRCTAHSQHKCKNGTFQHASYPSASPTFQRRFAFQGTNA